MTDDNDNGEIYQSELRYRRLFETAQDGILILNFETGVIEDANQFITDLLGYRKSQLIGKELWEIGAMIDKTAAISAFSVLKEKGYIRYEDLPLKTKDGRILNVEFISNAYGVNGGRVIQCNIRDISKRRTVEAELLKYQNSVTISMREMIETLSTIVVARDSYTGLHMKRVAHLSVAIAKEMGYSAHIVEGINMSALVHDIGKMKVPAEILSKSFALTENETIILQGHVQAGYEMLKHIHFPWNIAQAVLQHHERLDGSGFPYAIKGDVICTEAKVIGVADAFDSLCFDRPYRKGLGIDNALEAIAKDSGKLYDEKMVMACLKLFKEKDYAHLSHFYE